MVELDLFVPFLRTPDGCSALLEVLGTAYAELLNLQSRAEFETAVTNRHSFLPFLISSIFRRPSEQLPFAHGTQACKRWHQLRLQVLDTLSRACETSKSRSGSEPVVHALVSSSAAALDICSLYAYDQLEACQHIMDAIVQKRASLEEIGNTMLHVEDHLAQLHAWAQQVDASASPQKMNDIMTCLEDTVGTLLSLFLATPRLCGSVMRESDHAFTSTLAHLHDVFLRGTLQELLMAGPPVAGPSTSKSANVGTKNDGEALLAALVDMQIPGVDHRKSLLAKLPEHGLIASIDEKLRCSELDLDEAQYLFVTTLCNLPDKPMPGVVSDSGGNKHAEVTKPDVPAAASQKKAPAYNRAHKLAQIETVKACLPEEDETLIEACLASMEWNTDRVVDAILQDKLPGHLRAKAGGSSGTPGNELVYAPGKATSFSANRGQVKDMKQKTFELLQLAEDAEDEYDDEYDDGFDALNFVKGGRDVRMEADSTDPDKRAVTKETETQPPEAKSGNFHNGQHDDEAGGRGWGRGRGRGNPAGRRGGGGRDRGRGSTRGRNPNGRGGRGRG